MSQTFQVRPSELLRIEDSVLAFMFDRAVFHFGVAIDADLEEAGQKAKNVRGQKMKQQMVLNRWLGTTGKGRFRDPARR
jgi:hypothetical protein